MYTYHHFHLVDNDMNNCKYQPKTTVITFCHLLLETCNCKFNLENINNKHLYNVLILFINKIKSAETECQFQDIELNDKHKFQQIKEY